MTYIKKVWELGEDITPEELNNMEDGILSAHEKIDNKSDLNHNHEEYAKKTDLDVKADKETTYTKVETNQKIKDAINAIPPVEIPDVDLTNYYNKQEVDQKISEIVPPDVDISSKADKTYVDSELTKVNNELTKKADKTTTYTKTETDGKIKTAIDNLVIPNPDLSNYYNKSETDNKLDLKADKTELENINNQLHTHTNKDAIDSIKLVDSMLYPGNKRVEIDGNYLFVVKHFLDLKTGDVIFAGEFIGLPNESGYETLCYVNSDIQLDEFTSGSNNLETFISTNYLYLESLPFTNLDMDDMGNYTIPDKTYTKKQMDEIFQTKFNSTTELNKKADKTYVDKQVETINGKLPTSEQIAMIHEHNNRSILSRVMNTSNQFNIGDLPLESRDFPFQEGEYLHAGDWILDRDSETLNYFKVLITDDAFQWTNSIKGSAYSYGVMASMNQCAIISETDFTQGYTRPATEKDLELYAVKSTVDSEIKKINDTLNGVTAAVDNLLEVTK